MPVTDLTIASIDEQHLLPAASKTKQKTRCKKNLETMSHMLRRVASGRRSEVVACIINQPRLPNNSKESKQYTRHEDNEMRRRFTAYSPR